MGILHKLVFLLQKLDPKNEIWKEIQLERASKEADTVFRAEKDKQEREKLLEEINENFDESINYPDYARKLYLIENCIYGVDIQPIAIQISKLRFFISLILDQKVDKSKPNFGILTLPNLETKFVAANTLIGLDKPIQKSLRNPDIERLEQELKFLRHRYFRIKSRAEKIQLQNEDRKLREELKNALIGDGWNNEVAEKIVKFDIFDQNASADWFDPEWMFGVVDGFDIVIGNPPYVRQEKIKDKDLIIDSISKCFVENGKSLIKTNKRSDLYIYFYYKGLSLLKTSGVLCYISSNSWLDVGFGAEFQEFLLKYMHPLMIVDNMAERSFEAGINTVIVLIKRPEKISLDDVIKFVMFKKPFDEILNSEILKIVRQTYDRVINEDFRVIPKTRRELWIEGIEFEGDEIKEKDFWRYNYIGDKWGGKYLRAPEIFFKILEKGKDKLVRLGDIAEIKRGLVTGLDSYLFLSEHEIEQYRIEKKFLRKVLRSPRDSSRILIRATDINTFSVYTDASKSDLKGTTLYEYLIQCEKQGALSRATAKNKEKWYVVDQEISTPCICFPRAPYERHIAFIIEEDVLINDMVIIKPYDSDLVKPLGLYFNSTLCSLFLELISRTNLGLGTLKFEKVDALRFLSLSLQDLPLVLTADRSLIESFLTRPIKTIFEELGFQKCTQKNCTHPEHPYEYVKPEEVSFDRIMPDRRELDKIVFEAIGLTEEEQLEVYRAVIELVKNRLLKAKSK
jgi:hypothetical protein